MTAKQMIEAGFTYYNSCGVEFLRDCRNRFPVMNINQFEQRDCKTRRCIEAYEDSDCWFDTTNLQTIALAPALSGHRRGDDPSDSYGLAKKTAGDAGKFPNRKSQSGLGNCYRPLWLSTAAIQRSQHMTHLIKIQTRTRTDRLHVIGLDLTGPGGGQWTMHLQGQTVVACEPGIGKDDSVLRMPAEDFINLLSGCGKTLAHPSGHES